MPAKEPKCQRHQLHICIWYLTKFSPKRVRDVWHFHDFCNSNVCFIDINFKMQGSSEMGNDRREFGHSSSVSHTGCGVWLCNFWEQLVLGWPRVIFMLIRLEKRKLGECKPWWSFNWEQLFWNIFFSDVFYLGDLLLWENPITFMQRFLPESMGIF